MGLPAILLLLAFFAGPAAAIVLAPPPSPKGPVLVIALDPQGVVRTAQGRQIGPANAPFAVLATGDTDFVQRLTRAGAWHVSDGKWFAALCGISGDPA